MCLRFHKWLTYLLTSTGVASHCCMFLPFSLKQVLVSYLFMSKFNSLSWQKLNAKTTKKKSEGEVVSGSRKAANLLNQNPTANVSELTFNWIGDHLLGIYFQITIQAAWLH